MLALRAVPSRFVWKWPERSISGERDWVGLSGEVNRDLGADGLGEGLPAVDLTHGDLPRRQQRPEQHRRGFRGRQHGLRLDATLELLVEALDRVGNRYEDCRCPCPARIEAIPAYGATIRDRGTGSTKVWAGRFWTLSRELVLVAGRLCDSPGCAVSANP